MLKKRKMFGAYDVRGVWGKDLTPSSIKSLAYAFSEFFSEEIVGIGRDIRYSSDIMFNILCRYLNKEIYDYGIVSTPVSHYMSVVDDVDVLMITASHNPPEYNGIKPIKAGANDLEPQELSQLKELFEVAPNNLKPKSPKIENRFWRVNEYFEFLDSEFEFKDTHSLVYDPANGSGFIYSDFLSSKFKLIEINSIPDGHFPAHPPDPSKEENLKQLISEVVSKNCEFGLALDGDCDRLGFVYRGEWIKSDELVYFVAKSYLKRGDVVVLEVMLPFVLDHLLEDLGIKVVRVPTGHVNVKKYAREYDAKFFGEYSGHFGFREFYYIDDALYTFLKIVKLIEEIGFERDYPKIYQTRLDVPKDRVNLEVFISSFDPDETITIDGYDLRFEDSRVLIRESNTEPMYRIKIEALNGETFEVLLNKVKSIVGWR